MSNYHEECSETELHEGYASLEEDLNDEQVDKFIERKRKEFYHEWFKYIEKNNY